MQLSTALKCAYQVDVFLNAQLLQYHEKLCFVDFLDEIEDVQDFVLVFVEYLNNV